MAPSCSLLLLLLLLLGQSPEAATSLLRYRVVCGERGMQLLVHPARGRVVRFGVLDEFGTRFDVANCSICLHWLSTSTDGAFVFSSGYEGCHVLVKDDRYVLRMQLEELLHTGVPAASHQLNMSCPRLLGGYQSLSHGNRHNGQQGQRGDGGHQSQLDVLVPLSQPGLLQHVSQSALSLSGAHSELLHAVARTQPLENHHNSQPQRDPARPNQPGFLQPGLRAPNQPGMVQPGALAQPGLLHRGLRPPNQPGLVQAGAQTQTSLHTGLQLPNQPGMVQPGALTQPGLLHRGLRPPNQPGPVQPGAQTQPGLYPGIQPPNHLGLVQPGALTQPGLLHRGVQSSNQAGLLHSTVQAASAQTQTGAQHQNQAGFTRLNHQQPFSSTGHLRPGLLNQAGTQHQSHIQTGLLRTSHSQLGVSGPSFQSHPGFIRPGPQAQPQPGLVPPGLRPHAQPGVLQPDLRSQPSLLQSTALFYPSPGAVCGTPGHQLRREQCQVTVGRMPCVAPPGREPCLQAGCCYDDRDRLAPCYYGNTATVQCLQEGHFVLVVPHKVTQPYNLASVRLASAQPGCEPARATDTFLMFRFPVTQCGTTVQVMEEQLIYQNQLISTIDVQGSPHGSVTRDSSYILQARCIYNASDLLLLGMEVAVPPTATPLAMPGPLGLQLRIATDESYSSYHGAGDFPLVRVLRDPVYVEVRLLHKTDPNLVLVLHQCWASPSSQPGALPQWPILVDGCPFTGDSYRTQLVPVGAASPQLPFPSHYQRFAISTFTFVEPPAAAALQGEVYISCSASVCHLAQPEPCRPSCQLTARARRAAPAAGSGSSPGPIVTSPGPIVLLRTQRG
ncbi:zona pellucida sperm-binding protein 1 [Colius striatus]|uniref:zona pellucida sperm-binding protein 1 n=1 Tax=Colius striatus TaxID=57412 RepID=UPI002B1CEE0A|nr:zona pellucida sperm-binding protein 1 [Colius striatus]